MLIAKFMYTMAFEISKNNMYICIDGKVRVETGPNKRIGYACIHPIIPEYNTTKHLKEGYHEFRSV